MSRRNAIAKWFEYRAPVWRDVDEALKQVERGKSASPEAVFDVVRAYPEVARDLAIARREMPSGSLTRQLERIYLHLHRVIFRPPSNVVAEIKELFVSGAAEIAAALKWHIFAVTALFIVSCAAGWWLVSTYPELASLFASEDMIEQVSRGELWTDNLLNVVPSSLLSVQLFTNNVTVSLFAICLGMLFGLGTIYIIGINGVMLGSIFAFTAQYDMHGRLFEFVVAHGFVELSVICVAGGVGASLGEALARPGALTRTAAFQRAVMRGMRLMVVALAFMVGAGLVEGYVSPNPNFPFAARLAIGLIYWAVFLIVLTGGLGRLLERLNRNGVRSGSEP
ncbi:MAG: stage II sporulation protein M [Gammaproteobacteria bacterium]|nr:stage II sporulation protein M [Gammaproteobacteria bacterium]